MQVINKPAIELPQTIKTSQLHGPRTVLIGDAAHCVTPILGQGANAALEDASALVATITHPARGHDRPPTVDQIPEAYSRAKLADSRALVDLNRYMVFATGLGPLTPLAFVPILVSVALRTVLSLVRLVKKPALLRMAEGASYSAVVREVVTDCIGVAVLAVAVATGALATLTARIVRA